MQKTDEQFGVTRDRDAYGSAHCSVARALDVLRTRSTMLLLREAFYGTRRFDDFARRVGVTEQVAATRLKALLDEGLLIRVPYQEPGQRTRYEYRLTDKGRALYPVLVALLQWGDAHNPGPDGPPLLLKHRDCGATVSVEVRCSAGHEVAARDVMMVPGPGLEAARNRRAAANP
ncbi:MAG: transcriptional regulator [Pseudonocardiales bacterium]|nr:MAG: transcriptional regulator [Pseudonocardiales bacterium]